jgi:hypothetical protein
MSRDGTAYVHVTCSNNPFRLETEVDCSRINAFFGQIRDRLILLLKDERKNSTGNNGLADDRM